MKRFIAITLFYFFAFNTAVYSAGLRPNKSYNNNLKSNEPFDSLSIDTFFSKHSKLKSFRPEVITIYRKHQYNYIWFDQNGLTEFAEMFYSKLNTLDQEGLKTKIPYQEQLRNAFQNSESNNQTDIEIELLLTSLYFFYFNRVYKGVDVQKTQQLGWYLPRKKQSYGSRLDSLLQDPTLFNKKDINLVGQYYALKEVLSRYRQIEKSGGWAPIIWPKKRKILQVGDTAAVVLQIRNRLYISGDIKTDSKKNKYDQEMLNAVLLYKERNGFEIDAEILPKHITDMNISVTERIKTIMVNMERCRWIPTSWTKNQQYIIVNIPSFKLNYFKNGKPILESRVVVGKTMNRTVVFSGIMSHVIFSPYWNVPSSILKKEILPAIAKNPNYLEQHNMEWVGEKVRQKPGPKNSLGLVKFIFPNSYSIYMHDTPAKSLFDEEQRAFSHGCVRVGRAKDLANAILKDDKNWTPEKINAAMNRGIEKAYKLKNKIPVYIGYFTAWVDRDGIIHFYDDIYSHDKPLARLLLSD